MLIKEMQSPPTITDLTKMLADSLHEVRGAESHSIPVDAIESASSLVYRAMTNQSRHYHDLSHLFDVADDLPALAKLAAIYHDVVYFSVDGGLTPEVSKSIGDAIAFHDDRIFLSTLPNEMVLDVATIFGFTSVQEVKLENGLSEFLSAVLAVRELSKFLNDQKLWAVAACIEATIPFRSAVNGLTPEDLLGKRLGSLRRGNLALTEEEIHEIKLLAVKIANADVQSFGKPDLSNFIANTWQILSESNKNFHQSGSFFIRMYREDLMRMKTFLSMLQPKVIFRQYGNTPDHDAYQAQIECSRNHLRDSLEYVKAHIAAISVVEALAELSGGDAPLSDFIGAADSGIFQYLDGVNSDHPLRNEKALAELKRRHAGVQRFDHALLPLAAYFYELLGTDGISELVDRAHDVLAGKQNWRWFLTVLPRDILSPIVTVISQCAVMRKDRLAEWISL